MGTSNMHKNKAAERLEIVATAENRGVTLQMDHEPRRGEIFFRRSAAPTRFESHNQGLRPWLGSFNAPRLIFLICGFFSAALPLFAQAPVRLTLDDAKTMALANHPQVLAA